MDTFTYKIETVDPESQADYAIRYTPDKKTMYAKTKGGKEFKTNLAENDTAFDVFTSGKEVTKEQYDAF